LAAWRNISSGYILAFFGVGCYLLARQIQATRYMAVESVVVDHRIIYENDPDNHFGTHSKRPTYYDIVEYEIAEKKYRKTADTPSSVDTPSDDIGKIITIYVNREDPTDVVFKNSTHILLTTLCLIFPAGGFVGVGFMFRKAYQIKKDD
jgi:hypothetical protein